MIAVQLEEGCLIPRESRMTPMAASLLHGAEFLSTPELIRLTQELQQLCIRRQSTDLSKNDIESLWQMNTTLDSSVPGEESKSKSIKQTSLLATLATLEPIEEDFPDVDEGLLPLDDIVL